MDISQIVKRLLTVCALGLLPALSLAQAADDLVHRLMALPEAGRERSIVLTWNLPESLQKSGVTGFAIYRSPRPIYDAEEVSRLEPVAFVQSNMISYTDTVPDSAEYYYAVVSLTDTDVTAITNDSTAYEEPFVEDGLLAEADAPPIAGQTEAVWTGYVILPGVNATITGVRAEAPPSPSPSGTAAVPPASPRREAGSQTTSGLRPQPLPYIDLPGTADGSTHEQQISPQAEQSARALLNGNRSPAKERLEQYIFTEDMISPTGGDEYLLFDVLKNSFIRRDYARATRYLEQFLAQNRNTAVTRRATFYLGESYYFTGDYINALNKFLSLSDIYPALSRKWIDSCLDFYQMMD